MVIRRTNKVQETHLWYWFFKPDRLVKVSDFFKWFQSDFFKNRLKLEFFWVLLLCCPVQYCTVLYRPDFFPRIFFPRISSPDFFSGFFPGFFSPILDHRGVQGFISKLKSGKKIQRYEIMLDFFSRNFFPEFNYTKLAIYRPLAQ